MATFRVDVRFDYEVTDGTDPDEFHDQLRDRLEEGYTDFSHDAYRLETVREIGIEVLDD